MSEDPGNDHAAHGSRFEDTTLKGAVVRLMHPIPLTIMLILVGVILLIAANVLGLDSGDVLRRMSGHEFARGLITYLFAVTTIGTAVALVLAALMGEIQDHAYQRGKEILALLLGVFGTIVGFYFGSDTGSHREATQLTLSAPLLSVTTVSAGGTVSVTALASGGTPPYRFAVGVGSLADARYDGTARGDGWIVTALTVPVATAAGPQRITISVRDAEGAVATAEAAIAVSASGSSP